MQPSFSVRLILWKQAVNLIKQHPFFGVGPQHFAYYPNEWGAHPHNAVLLFATEWGLPVIHLINYKTKTFFLF